MSPKTTVYIGLILCAVFSTTIAAPPTFDSQASRFVRVREDEQVGSIIKTFNVTDTDPGEEIHIIVSDPTTNDYVNFTQTTGHNILVSVILKRSLDRDRGITSVRLMFTATDKEGNQILLEFDMYIEDVNDEMPIFLNEPYRLEIPENSLLGSVYSVSASDLDGGYGGYVTYAMKPDSRSVASADKYNKTFSIDNSTGQIRLMKPLDYETNSYYQFAITAQDMAPPYHRVSALLIFRVLDVEDTPPFFTGISYRALIRENVPVGTAVLMVAATDGDPDVLNAVDFRILGGECMSYFNIDSLGLLKTAKWIDREAGEIKDKDGVCSLTVQAFETNGTEPQYGNTTAVTTVTVVVEDVNDNPPVFVNSSGAYTASVEENTPVGGLVTFTNPGGMVIQDIDQGTNSILNITLNSPAFDVTPKTALGSSSLMIRVADSSFLDRETNDRISFQVFVEDGVHMTVETVTISLTDVNDNSPVFEMTRYHFVVHESISIGAIVGSVRATDIDAGMNGQIYYTLDQSARKRFMIDGIQGSIRIFSYIDAEVKAVHHLNVFATDGGGRRATANVTIEVLDDNDNAPVFQLDSYWAVITENDPKYNVTPVAVIKAIDYDRERPNNQIKYFLESFSETWMVTNLTINSTTGAVYLMSPVDLEEMQNKTSGYGMVTAVVGARDSGLHVRFSSQATLTLLIQEEPDTSQMLSSSSVATPPITAAPVSSTQQPTKSISIGRSTSVAQYTTLKHSSSPHDASSSGISSNNNNCDAMDVLKMQKLQLEIELLRIQIRKLNT